MALSIVRLGSPRGPHEGLRLGTVRRPPRGVPKAQFAALDYYDVWVPLLSPSAELMAQGKAAATPAQWARFERQFRAQMKQPEASQVLDLLAALSQQADLALGCYCTDEARCHRSILRELLAQRGARMASA